VGLSRDQILTTQMSSSLTSKAFTDPWVGTSNLVDLVYVFASRTSEPRTNAYVSHDEQDRGLAFYNNGHVNTSSYEAASRRPPNVGHRVWLGTCCATGGVPASEIPAYSRGVFSWRILAASSNSYPIPTKSDGTLRPSNVGSSVPRASRLRRASTTRRVQP